MNTTYEINQGTSGNGHPVFLVICTRAGLVSHIEYFDTRHEAQNWIDWS